MKTFLKTILKIALAMGAVLAAITAFLYLTDKKTDYIEIYNDDDEGDLL